MNAIPTIYHLMPWPAWIALASAVIAIAARYRRQLKTLARAAKMLPTVRRALPWYVWPILTLATMVKCLPVDFGADETLFAIAFAIIAWRRPGLLTALYREASNGKPERCACAHHA